MNTHILLVRHGETEWTADDRFNGRTDIPLSEKGKIQASYLGLALRNDDITVCFATPLQRTQSTARLALEGRNVDIIINPQLIEADFGAWEGLSRQQIKSQFPKEWERWNADPAGNFPLRGESGYQVAARVIPALNDIIAQYAGKTILIIAHNTVNRVILAHVLGLPLSEFRRKILQLPSGLNRIDISKGGEMRVTLLNDVSHFDDPNSPAAPRMSRTGEVDTNSISPQSVIKTDGGAFIGGGVNTGGGKFVGRDDHSKTGMSAGEIQFLFRDIYSTIEQKQNISPDEKVDIKTELDEVKQELAKGDKADETFLQRRLRNIGRIAPDILEVTLAMMANPAAGLGLVAMKIADKMKQQANKGF